MENKWIRSNTLFLKPELLHDVSARIHCTDLRFVSTYVALSNLYNFFKHMHFYNYLH